ncbi:CBS domain-containing protein [Haloarchaeobius sp. HRN-SO-5]|uniref:CBS domain-containing protein n=1 Tax=Haloarchaeobius sp. HRN-SO-5 TaxID=3446118 RepID=UPI003EBBA338
MIAIHVEAVATRTARTVTPETAVTEAARALRDPGVTALVVLGADETVDGIVTQSDVVAHVADGSDPATVASVLSSPVVTVSPDATLSEAAERMRTNGVGHLPVVEDGVYRGIVSAETLAPYLSRRNVDVAPTADRVAPGRGDATQVTADEA